MSDDDIRLSLLFISSSFARSHDVYAYISSTWVGWAGYISLQVRRIIRHHGNDNDACARSLSLTFCGCSD